MIWTGLSLVVLLLILADVVHLGFAATWGGSFSQGTSWLAGQPGSYISHHSVGYLWASPHDDGKLSAWWENKCFQIPSCSSLANISLTSHWSHRASFHSRGGEMNSTHERILCIMLWSYSYGQKMNVWPCLSPTTNVLLIFHISKSSFLYVIGDLSWIWFRWLVICHLVDVPKLA